MITPRLTEKAYVAETQHTYVFYVDRHMSKQAIAKAIADEFKVTVVDVRVLTRKGKATRFSRGKHTYPGTAYRQDHKVAYVTLKDTDKLPFFEAEKKDDKKSSKNDTDDAKKSDQKTDKKAAKTVKKATKTKKTEEEK